MMTDMIKSDTKICMRHGYNCSCHFCLPWIARWESEVNGFALLDTMLEEGRSLFYVYEKLRAEYTELLSTHSQYIVDEYYKRVHNKGKSLKAKKRKSIGSSSASTESF